MIEIRMSGTWKHQSGYQHLLFSGLIVLHSVSSGVRKKTSLLLEVVQKQSAYATMSKKITGGSVNLSGRNMTLLLQVSRGTLTIYILLQHLLMENAEFSLLSLKALIKRE